jgi:Trk-type K+ transport system membrane component
MRNGIGYSMWSPSWILYGLVVQAASITVFAALGLANCFIIFIIILCTCVFSIMGYELIRNIKKNFKNRKKPFQ